MRLQYAVASSHSPARLRCSRHRSELLSSKCSGPNLSSVNFSRSNAELKHHLQTPDRTISERFISKKYHVWFLELLKAIPVMGTRKVVPFIMMYGSTFSVPMTGTGLSSSGNHTSFFFDRNLSEIITVKETQPMLQSCE